MGESAFEGSERYTIVRRIGAGGFGVVYEALDHLSGERIALKTLREVQPESLYRLKREFRALADVDHPNLITLYELAAADDQWFFTMELIDGVDFLEAASMAFSPQDRTRDLGDASQGQRQATPTRRAEGFDLTVPVATALASSAGKGGLGAHLHPLADLTRLRPLVRQLAEGVAGLHRHGMLHRDLKPSNVLVTRDDRVVILDFGLVTETDRRRSLNPQLIGTIEYMSPEQAAGEPATAASDWYSVGVILFEALTGTLPFTGSLVDMVRAKVSDEAPAVTDLVPEVPEDLATLCARLLARDPTRRPDAAAILEVLGVAETPLAPPTPSEGLVGREPELAALFQALARSRDGRAVVVELHGPAGIGKSAIVEGFLRRLEASSPQERRGPGAPALILQGRCYERESVPYRAIDPLIDALGRELREREQNGEDLRTLLPPAIKTLARLFPVLRRVPTIEHSRSSSDDSRLDRDELRQRGFGALRDLFSRLAAAAPLVVVIDDLHWGDRDSAALLAELLRAPTPPAMLLLLTYRDAEAARSECLELLQERLVPHPGLVRLPLPLGHLPTRAAESLARGLLEGSGREDEAAAIACEADQSPLYIVELCRLLRAATAEPAGSRRRPATDARGSLDAVLQSRLVDLEPAARALLEITVLAGKPIAPALALRAAEIGEGGRQPLAELRRQHLLRAGGGRLEPAHGWVRAAVLGDLPRTRETALHRALAAAHESLGTGDLDALVGHLVAAGEPQRAYPHAADAATRAADALAFDRAAELYRVALDGEPPAPTRAALLGELGDALVNAGRGAEAATAYLEAATWYADTDAGDDAPRALDLRRRAGFELLRSGHIDRGIAVLQEVLRGVGMRLATRPSQAVVALLRHRLALRLRGLHFREPDPSTVDPDLLQRADVAWSVGASGLGMVDDLAAGEYQSLALRLALKAGEPSRVLRALAGEIAFSAVGGSQNHRRTAHLLRTARALAERQGRSDLRGMLEMTSGIAAHLEGRFAEAVAATARAESLLSGPGAAWDRVNARLWGLQAAVYRGGLGAVGARVPDLLRDAERRGDIYLQASLWTCPTHLWWLARDLPEEVAGGVAAARQRWSSRGFQVQHYWQLSAATNIDLYRGEVAAARQRLDTQWRRLAKLLRIQFVAIEASFLRARAALAGPLDRRWRRRLHRDIARITAQGAPWGLGLAALLRAGVAARTDDRRRADLDLAEAIACFDGADMALYAALARFRRGQVVGGQAGTQMLELAATWLRTQGVANPGRLADALAPGFASFPGASSDPSESPPGPASAASP